MTNHELLSGFLERSLSEDQLLEFEARQSESPEFATEVREMLKVESLLTESAPEVVFPTAFLSSVEASVAAKVVAGVAVTGLLAGISHTLWTWIAGSTAAVVIGGGAVYLAQRADEKPANSSNKTVISTPSKQAPAHPLELAPAEQMPANNSTRMLQSPPANTSGSAIPASLDAQVETPNSSAREQLITDYMRCSASNDHVACSNIALQLGRTYSRLGNSTEAQKYLESSIRHASAVRLTQFEVQARGELGKLAIKDGNIAEATQQLRTAIELGKSRGIDVSVWASLLAGLSK